MRLYRELDHQRGVSYALGNLGIVAAEMGDYDLAFDYQQQGLQIDRERKDVYGIATSLNSLGILANRQGDFASALSYFEEALVHWRELGDSFGLASTLHNLKDLFLQQGDLDRATATVTQALQIDRERGDRSGIASGLLRLGNILFEQREFEAARERLYEGLKIICDMDERLITSAFLFAHANLAQAENDLTRAMRLLGAWSAARQALMAALSPVERRKYEILVSTIQARTDDTTFEWEYSVGLAMPLEEAVTYALTDQEPAATASADRTSDA